MLNSRKFLTSTTKSLNRIQYSIKNKSDFKYFASPTSYKKPEKLKRDVIIIGGGHNALVTAFYLRKAGLDVLVLERRHVIGGAAVTEELLPGKISFLFAFIFLIHSFLPFLIISN